MAYLKTILIAFLCLPATIHAAESPADTINMVLQSLSKGDISPLIARLSDTDRKEFQGVRSQPGLQYIKDNLNLPSEVTSGWGEYEYRVANDYIRDWGVVKSKKDPGLEKTYQQAYVRDQWVQGDYAEVDLVFPMSGFKYPPGLIRFVLFKESGVWRISHLGSIFMTASMMIPPMRSVNPFVLGDYADFCFSYVYGDNFAKIQYGAPELEKFSMYRRLRAISAAVSAKAVSYVASGAVTAPAGGRKKKLIYDEKGNPVGEMKYDLSHKRSKKNPYLAMSPENQLLMLGNPFMPAGQAYIHFSEKFKADTALAAKAMGVAGAAYMRSENFEKAAEAYEVAAAGSDPAERMAAKKALVDIYMNRLRQPKKAEQHQRDLETSGLVPEYDRLQVAAPETLLVRSEPETKRLVDFEVGADSETLYLLFHEGHYKDSPNWVESTVVEYRIYGSSKVISSVRNERIDSSSFFYLGKGEDGLWIYGNGGHGYKINYAGNLQKYFSDARTSVVYNTPQEKFLKFPNMSWSGMMISCRST